METDQRFFWRRANEELKAAARAVTPQAERRHRELAQNYINRLKQLPEDELVSYLGLPEIHILVGKVADPRQIPGFEWPLYRKGSYPSRRGRTAEWPVNHAVAAE